MRHCLKNKISMNYALFLAELPKYETDDDENVIYITVDGKQIPVETGEKDLVYQEAIPFKASFSESGGDAEAQSYGLSIADYEAKISYSNGSYPLKEGSLVWVDSAVGYKYNGETVGFDVKGEKVETKVPDRMTADYQVIKISKTKNESAVLLKAINK